MKNTLVVTLDELLLLIGIRGESGEVHVEAGNNIGSITIHAGNILHVSSPYARAIGDLLVEDGVLGEDELIEILRLQKRGEYMPLGALLVKTGKVPVESIEAMVHEQIRKGLTDLHLWKQPHIVFHQKATNPYDHIYLPIRDIVSPALLTQLTALLSAGPRKP